MKKKLIGLSILVGLGVISVSCGNRMEIQHYHYYQPESQVWNWVYGDDNIPLSATVSIKCTNKDGKCDAETVTLNATITNAVIENENCCETGLIRYTASAVFNDTTYTQSKDIIVDKTNHSFTKFYSNSQGHAHECEHCGLLEEDLQEHAFTTLGVGYYTCSVCNYVDLDRKARYDTVVAADEISILISGIIDETPNAYDEAIIRTVDTLYSGLNDEGKSLVTNYDRYLSFKSLYYSTYEIIIGDDLVCYGYNTETKNSETEIKVRKNILTDYGYGYKFNIYSKSNKNVVKVASKTPTYRSDDEYEGIFYTHNIPLTTTVGLITEDSGKVLLDTTINKDIGNGWVERKISKEGMNGLISQSYSNVFYQLGTNDAQALEAGEYFISCLYAVKPEIPTTGVHYLAKENTTSTPGNREYWVYDGRIKAYLENPDPSIIWRDEESPALDTSHVAYLAKKGTTKVNTISMDNWTYTIADPDNKHYLACGMTPSLKTGGEYAAFRNYLWNDWKEEKVGLTATYTIPSMNDLRYVNTFEMTYYLYQPKVPVLVTIIGVDQYGNTTEILQDSFKNCPDGAVTAKYPLLGFNFKYIVVTTKAYAPGLNGDSNFFMKNVSLYYDDASLPVGNHYAAVEANQYKSGNKEYWIKNDDPTIYVTNPVKDGFWLEGKPEPITDENHPAYLAQYGEASINLESADNWTVTSKEAAIKMEFDQTLDDHNKCATFRNYQYFDWNASQLGLSGVYTNPSNMIGANTVSFDYYVKHDNDSIAKADLYVSIFALDKQGNEREIDSFTINKDKTGWNSYSYEADVGNFYQLKIVTVSEFIEGLQSGGINTILYVNNMTFKYAVSPYGSIKISSTDASLWSFETADATNKMFVGCPANYEEAKTFVKGEFICLRNYQWFDWKNPNQSTLKATYTINNTKIINSIDFDYFIESASYEGESTKVSISMINSDDETVAVDNFTILKDTVTKDELIHYHKSLPENVEPKKLIITMTAFKEGLESGGLSCPVFYKNITCKFLLG